MNALQYAVGYVKFNWHWINLFLTKAGLPFFLANIMKQKTPQLTAIWTKFQNLSKIKLSEQR